MEIIDFNSGKTKINIQIKLSPQIRGENFSKSLTMYGMSVDEAYNRIAFMFNKLAESNKEVTIKHHKKTKLLD